jgi:hypothetical protein
MEIGKPKEINSTTVEVRKRSYWKYVLTDYELWPTVYGKDHRRYDKKRHVLQKT